jgi:hypothetical protein
MSSAKVKYDNYSLLLKLLTTHSIVFCIRKWKFFSISKFKFPFFRDCFLVSFCLPWSKIVLKAITSESENVYECFFSVLTPVLLDVIILVTLLFHCFGFQKELQVKIKSIKTRQHNFNFKFRKTELREAEFKNIFKYRVTRFVRRRT